MSQEMGPGKTLKIFFSYAQEDKVLRDALAKQLSGLKRQGLITNWHDGEIQPGSDWRLFMEKYLRLSDIILLLISPDFIVSDYLHDVTLKQAIERHQQGETRVIPILLRPTDFKSLPFGKLQYLPTNGRAVTLWKNRDSAFLHIVEGIRKVVEELWTKLHSEPHPLNVNHMTGPDSSSRFWKVPYRRNPLFTGHRHLLDQIHTIFFSQESRGISTQAITGLGGMGKTQIVLEYAYHYVQDYQAIIWIGADPQGDIVADFVMIAHILQLPEAKESDQSRIIMAVKRWLQQKERWLLIFDNVEDINRLNDFIPESGTGHILITTRSRATGNFAIAHEVEQMEAEVGALFLLKRAKINPQTATSTEEFDKLSSDAAKEISRLLGGLPLALDQAGAYLEETQRYISDFIHIYQQRQATLLDRRGKINSAHPNSVATTFSLVFEQVSQTHPGAAELLRFCAFLHPDAIPEEIIIEAAPHLSPDLQPIASDPFELDIVIEALLQFSLLKRSPSTKTVSIHRLVQIVTKNMMKRQTQITYAQRAIQTVNNLFPDAASSSTWLYCQRYLPHAKFCALLIEEWQINSNEAIQLLVHVGYYLYMRAQYDEAELFYNQALKILDQNGDQITISQTLNNLGDLYLAMGRYPEAEQYFIRGLHIRERLLEYPHAALAESLNNLAGVYDHQEMYTQAEPLYQQALTIQEQLLGPEHADTIQTLNNLALLYDHQGRYSQAENLHLKALELQEKVLGPDHINVARSLQNLGRLYRIQKRYVEAEQLLLRALTIRETILGPEHPQTATTVHGLGLLYECQNKNAEAERWLKRALHIQEKVLGPEHPRTMTILEPLADVYMRQGKDAEAELLLQQLLCIQHKKWGVGHAKLLPCLTLLAQVYDNQQQYSQAASLYQQIAIIQENLSAANQSDLDAP